MFVSYARARRCCARNAEAKEEENDAVAGPDAIKEAVLRTRNQAVTHASMGRQLCEAHRVRRRARIIATAVLAASVATATALAVYLVFRPLEPQASVVRAAVYHMATTAGNSSSEAGLGRGPPYTLAASARFTTLLHNPSDRAVVLYDGLFAYVTYRGAMVAPPVPLPGVVVQERGADVALSPRFGLGVGGAVPVPVSADTAQALEDDCAVRRVELRLVVMGRVKYRSGPFRTGWRGLYVRCDVTVGLGVDAAAGDDVEAGDVPLLVYPKCSVDA